MSNLSVSGVDVGKSTDVSGVPQCATDFSGMPGGKAKFVVIHPEDEMLRMDGFISKSDGIGALLSKITEFRQIDPASPTRNLCASLWQRKCSLKMP